MNLGAAGTLTLGAFGGAPHMMGGVEGITAMRVAVLAALLVAGCANYGIEQRQAELAPLVGQGEAALVQRMGVPTRTYEVNGTKFLAYNQSRVDYYPGAPYFGGFYGHRFYGGYGGYWGGAFAPEVIERTCETTFEVTAGLVKSFALRGNSCGSLV